MTTIILYIIIYLLLGLFISTYIMTNELSFIYATVNEFLLTIVGAVLWPILLVLFLMSLAIHYIYKLLCLG